MGDGRSNIQFLVKGFFMEKKRFFTGTQIAGIIIFILVGLTCTSGLIMAQIAKASMPIQIVIPASGLSDSIFDAQNSVYEADADFPVEHQFEHLSDVVDVPNRQTAMMGNGTFWRITDGFYVYISEGKRSSFADAVFSETAPILLTGADKKSTDGQLVKSEKGYLNGREFDYVVFDIICNVGEKTTEAYIVGYLYEDSESGYSTLIACVTEDISTNGLLNAQIIAQKEATLLHTPQEKK